MNNNLTSRLYRLTLITLALAVLAALAVLIYLNHFQLPAPTGPYHVGTDILDLTDPTRPEPHDPTQHRTVVVQLWYPTSATTGKAAPYNRPAETTLSTVYTPLLATHSFRNAPVATAGAPFPVILMSHRWNGQRTQNTLLAEDLASHGYIVASIDHPYNATRVELTNGRVIQSNEALEPAGQTAPEEIALWNQNLDLWAADSLFVLNQLAAHSAKPTDPFHNRLDLAHTGALGHSFGGGVSLALLGRDPRILSAVNLDGWTFAALDRRTTQPILIFYEGKAGARRAELAHTPSPGTKEDRLDTADYAAVDASANQHGATRLYIAGTQHMDFTDQPLLPPLRRTQYTGPIPPQKINNLLRQTVLAFFDQTLRNRPTPFPTFPETTTDNLPPPASALPVAATLYFAIERPFLRLRDR